MVETFENYHAQLRHACFPAASLRHASRSRFGGGGGGGGGGLQALAAGRLALPGGRLGVECSDSHSVVAAGVYYGHACADNPPCGQRNSLIRDNQQPPQGCGRTLPLSSDTGDAQATTASTRCFLAS
jgi:hypothetical protein